MPKHDKLEDHLFFIKEFEWKLIVDLEEDWGCSGICRPSLFFYSITGRPDKTCLSNFVDPVIGGVKGIGVASTFTGLTALMMFFFHFFLYHRGYTAARYWVAGMLPDKSKY
jgi:hypothetical protein